MKKNINKFYTSLLLGLVVMTSCNKDFMNLDPLNQITADQTWKDGALSTAFVTGIYGGGLYQGGFSEQMNASLTDEAVFTHTGRSINTVNEGSLSPSNLGWIDATYGWQAMYDQIRACNLVINNLSPDNSYIDAAVKDRLKGEAYFLRAYFYQQLLRYYGGVPLIDGTYNLTDDFTKDRSSYTDCVNFIVDDCDSAALLLNGLSMETGRASKLAAQALKSRVLIYAASDLHDEPTAKTKAADVFGSYAHPEVLFYTTGDRQARWTAARDAAKAVVDAGSGYKLNLTAPVSGSEGTANYIALSMGGGSADKSIDASASTELIFSRYFIADKDEGGRTMGLYNGPNGYHCWAGNTPIGLLVDDYEMMDGSAARPFDWNNASDKAKPYVNRDPRMYATIMYDGADWKPRNKISGDVDPANQIQTGEYDLMDGGSLIAFKGLDTRSSSIEDWNGSRSGYYMRKFIDPNPDLVDNKDRQTIPWPFLRYTEAVFNYIEASIELNELAEATLWLNRIRFRAGMPAITETTQSAIRERYRMEKRIEMAFEEQRYSDARRWMIAPATLGRKITFINVVGKFKPGKQMSKPYHHDETIYNYTYTNVVDNAHENRQWLNKMYYRAFDINETRKNTGLWQNPGYE
ncbi:MAG: RagB/SusD family nutrient uptake outer membrane protein [Agriterribacter sp.]